jgi:hypothetical protein
MLNVRLRRSFTPGAQVQDPAACARFKSFHLGDCELRTREKGLSEFDKQVCNEQQTTGYECDQLQIIPSLLFLSCFDLRECSLSGLVDEFVGRMFHASIA